jgi:hypothetical protein
MKTRYYCGILTISDFPLQIYKIVISLHLMNNTVFISLELPGVDALYDIYLF